MELTEAIQKAHEKIGGIGGIYDTKLNTISTAGKVSGTAITGLASLPAGAGAVPKNLRKEYDRKR